MAICKGIEFMISNDKCNDFNKMKAACKRLGVIQKTARRIENFDGCGKR